MTRHDTPPVEGCAMLAIGFVALCLTAVVLLVVAAVAGVY